MGQKELDLVKIAHAEDPSEFQQKFSDMMGDRITAALGAKQADVAKHILTPDSFEAEGEELDVVDFGEQGEDDDGDGE